MTIPITSLQLEHIPRPHTAYITLFKDVKNAIFLRDQLLAGNTEFEYAFIDANTIISKVHALAAAHQAIHNLLVAGKLRTRNVHSETVFCLSPNNNITDAFKRFGILPTTTSLLCIKFSTPSAPITLESIQLHLERSVEGTAVEFTDENLLQETVVDWVKVAKNYKIKTDNLNTQSLLNEKAIGGGLKSLEVEVLGKLVVRTAG
ncbi:protein cgi121 [Morchella snyderi]|nr:protein cgi121 [Morchella snyderi]